MRRLLRAIRQPGAATDAVLAIVRGHTCKRWSPLRGIPRSARRGLRVGGRLTVRRPGGVRVGDPVQVRKTVTSFTNTDDARSEVGAGVLLSETRVGRDSLLRIGPARQGKYPAAVVISGPPARDGGMVARAGAANEAPDGGRPEPTREVTESTSNAMVNR